MCGLLLRSMYGTQDRFADLAEGLCQTAGWQTVETGKLERSPVLRDHDTGQSSGPRRRRSTPRRRRRREEDGRDFKSRYDCKSRGVLGPDPEDDSEVTYLNRVIRYVKGSQPRIDSDRGRA
eukprot:3582788-Amphidinium_carterae.2